MVIETNENVKAILTHKIYLHKNYNFCWILRKSKIDIFSQLLHGLLCSVLPHRLSMLHGLRVATHWSRSKSGEWYDTEKVGLVGVFCHLVLPLCVRGNYLNNLKIPVPVSFRRFNAPEERTDSRTLFGKRIHKVAGRWKSLVLKVRKSYIEKIRLTFYQLHYHFLHFFQRKFCFELLIREISEIKGYTYKIFTREKCN